MVRVVLKQLGHVSSTIDEVVLWLWPVDDDNSVQDQPPKLFPIVMQKEVASIYLLSLSQILPEDMGRPQISHFFEMATKTRLTALHVYPNRYGKARAFMLLTNSAGGEDSFRVPLAKGVMTALLHRLPILVDRSLLVQLKQPLNTKVEEGAEMVPDEMHRIFKTIKNQILNGIAPDESTVKQLFESGGQEHEEEITQLLNLSVEEENYEWAVVLKKIREDIREDNGGVD